uniref:Uncharacterized protein n=1 Tax=gamma proteobacterium D250 TaxID=649546 RepID=M4HXD2_9GAMM|nr:hypothetical protein [gamma proteobacterium D250]
MKFLRSIIFTLMWIPISSVAYEVKLEFNQEVEDYCPIVNQHINSAVESGGGGY